MISHIGQRRRQFRFVPGARLSLKIIPGFPSGFVAAMAWALSGLGAHDVGPGTAISANVPEAVVDGHRLPWLRHVIDDSSTGADGVKLADLNGDGRPEIVTGWEEGGEVRVYLNPPIRDVKRPWPRVTVGRVSDPEDAIFVDIDRDGRLDVVSCTEGRTRTVYWHRFTGGAAQWLNAERWKTMAFPAVRGTQMWMQVVAADLDGQHGPDLVLAAKGEGATVGWLQSPPEPDNLDGWAFHPLRDAGWIMSLILYDMDRDGDLDLVLSDRKGRRSGVFWLENPGGLANRDHQAWAEHVIGGLGREVMFADLGDLNRDGWFEVAVAVKPLEILLCRRPPVGAWREQALRLDGSDLGFAKAVQVADLNGDGPPDLLFTCEGASNERDGIVWLERQVQGPWLQHTLGGPAGVKFDLTQVLDLDADGDLDVITCEEGADLGVIWYENPTQQSK